MRVAEFLRRFDEEPKEIEKVPGRKTDRTKVLKGVRVVLTRNMEVSKWLRAEGWLRVSMIDGDVLWKS